MAHERVKEFLSRGVKARTFFMKIVIFFLILEWKTYPDSIRKVYDFVSKISFFFFNYLFMIVKCKALQL